MRKKNFIDSENAVLRLCQDNLSPQIQHSDILKVRRLPSKNKDLELNIIIKLTNHKARDMVFRVSLRIYQVLERYISMKTSQRTLPSSFVKPEVWSKPRPLMQHGQTSACSISRQVQIARLPGSNAQTNCPSSATIATQQSHADLQLDSIRHAKKLYTL